MDNAIPVEQELLEHQRRQTKALEGIHSAMMLLLALAIVGVLIGAAALFGS